MPSFSFLASFKGPRPNPKKSNIPKERSPISMASDDRQANMDEPGQGQSPVMAAGQIPYVTSPYQANQVMGNTATIPAAQLTAASQAQLAQQQQLSYQQVHQQQMHQLQQQLQIFWANQYQEIAATNDFKNHSLPLARIKKIMKADEDVRMIAAEAPVLFARACEMFILELTHRSWAHTEENKRRTLQKNDIAGAIMRTDAFDFLADIVPSEELKEEALSSTPKEGGPNDSLPYYFVPPLVGSMGGMMGKSMVDQALYARQPQAYLPQQMWEQQQGMQQQQQQQQQPADDS